MILNYWVVEPMTYGHRAVQYRSGKDGHGREVSGTTGGRLTFRRGGPDATLEALRTFLRERRCVEPMNEGPALEALRRVYPNMIEVWW